MLGNGPRPRASGNQLVHVPVTYRAAPLAGAESIGTLHHSVLGQRWVYDAASDPVAIVCSTAALRGRQQPEPFEIYDGDQLVERREAPVRVIVEEGHGTGEQLTFVRVLGSEPAGSPRLRAAWDGGEAVVAVLA